MMIPSKICTRSFSPSMTFTWTRTLSPGAKLPRSRFSMPASTTAIASVAMFVSPRCLALPRLTHWSLELTAPRLLVQPLALLTRQWHGVQEVRSPRQRAPERFASAPSGNPPVVAGQEDVRHGQPAEVGRARVLGVVEPARRERLPRRALGIAQHPGQEA